jgi:predicted GIY-YIG superfamily endonuclease
MFTVYRLYVVVNSIRQVLYVGQTGNVNNRLADHRYNRSPKFARHDRALAGLGRSTGVLKSRNEIQLEVLSEHETRRQARDAEVIAIKAALHEPYLINVRIGARPSDFEIARFKLFTKRVIPRTPQPVIATRVDGKSGFIFKSISEAAKILNINRSNICHALSGKHKQIGGFVWTRAA